LRSVAILPVVAVAAVTGTAAVVVVVALAAHVAVVNSAASGRVVSGRPARGSPVGGSIAPGIIAPELATPGGTAPDLAISRHTALGLIAPSRRSAALGCTASGQRGQFLAPAPCVPYTLPATTSYHGYCRRAGRTTKIEGYIRDS
jgi:hypothetical protein